MAPLPKTFSLEYCVQNERESTSASDFVRQIHVAMFGTLPFRPLR